MGKSFGGMQMNAVVLHGDLDQDERVRILDSFRKCQVSVLIATDLAARGLDIPSIHTVVSYVVARDIETHTHRVGRTGRAGAEGEAYTLLLRGEGPNQGQDRRMAVRLVEHLKQIGVAVTSELIALAKQSTPHRSGRRAGLATNEHNHNFDGHTLED